MDLKSIPLDSDYWKNPPLPRADNNKAGWLSWCQQMAEEKYENARGRRGNNEAVGEQEIRQRAG